MHALSMPRRCKALPLKTLTATAVTLLVLVPALCQAQAPPSQARQARTFTLEERIRYAQANYPSIRAALERVSAAKAGVSLARTSYLPHADALWQGNRATRNNIFGLLFPQSVISPISGPVLSTTSNQSVW